MGTRQSGVLQLRLADIVKDNDLLAQARAAAQQLLQNDPSLEQPENAGILRVMRHLHSKKGFWKYIS